MQFTTSSRAVRTCQGIQLSPGQMLKRARNSESLEYAKAEGEEGMKGIEGIEGTKIAVPCHVSLASGRVAHRLSSANAPSRSSAFVARGNLVARNCRFLARRALLSGASAIQPAGQYLVQP